MHRISVGFLGQYANQNDIVENLYIYTVSLTNSSDGARIKVWPGSQTSFQTLLNGGGGLGRVRNVTYDLFRNVNDRAITITQCSGQKNQTLCSEHPVSPQCLHPGSSSANGICSRPTKPSRILPSKTCLERLLRAKIHRLGL